MSKQTAKKSPPQDPERNELTKKIEGDMPYDRQAYVNIARRALKRTVDDIIEAGTALLILKEKEGYGCFMNIVINEIGIPYTSAHRFMHVALKHANFPKLQINQLVNLSSAYTLLEAPEEDLKELEEKGVLAGKDMDELAAMSVKEMRELVKHLKIQTSEIVAGHVKKLSTDNKKLRAEISRLTLQLPTAADDAWAEKPLQDINDALITFMNYLNHFAFDPNLIGNGNIKAKVEGLYQTGYRAFLEFIDKWEDYTGDKVRK